MHPEDIFSIFENACPECGTELAHTAVETHPSNVEDWLVDEITVRENFAQHYGEEGIMTVYTARCDKCDVEYYLEQSGLSGDWS